MCCVPHVPFLVVVLLLIMELIIVHRARCRGIFGVCVLFGVHEGG